MSKLEQQKSIENLNKVKYSLRSSQAVLQYGVGAMVDFPDQTLMTASPEYWAPILRIEDERLARALKVTHFGAPKNGVNNWGVAYVRFPEWYFCPRCRWFQPINDWRNEYLKKNTKKDKDQNMKRPRCVECRMDIIPARIVVACEKGHISDFPWIEWTHHRNRGGAKKVCSNPKLSFKTGAVATAGLEGLVVTCENCKASTTLARAFEKNAMQEMDEKFGKQFATENYRCAGRMPWKNKTEHCDCYPKVMQRGASSIYYPNIVSSLVIPPYSEKVNTKISESKAYERFMNYVEGLYEDEDEDEYDKDHIRLEIEKKIDRRSEEIAREIDGNATVIRNILVRRLLKVQDETVVPQANTLDYKREEYEALTGKIPVKDLEENEFICEEMNVDQYSIPHLNKIALVHKVREVRALTGFSRINPPNNIDSENGVGNLVSVKEPDTKWYPGYEVRGEGIFIEFKEDSIYSWIAKNPQVTNRIKLLNKSYSASYQGQANPKEITAKFVLLHTIAHMLIRQLSFDCGYTSASLRERIYCDVDEDRDDKKMSGILIYTASGDSEGTLGGLVRQGYFDRFTSVFQKAIEYGDLCSNDPICISSSGQGRESLNLAACHSCVLLPETCCEEFNVFLDRALLVGTFENKSIGFYSEWLSSFL
ncbi:DUF1998 domain-containing protein [Saccharibacillus qingshengii]|uniref:DUF1998 domain-containing protein n=1 Tax=Saccharibacillus qingshengii TaxID=1763540 RepID=UPI0015572C02|nr:DUF1998 domain-containing protein [Saccharibacillus qingshengii]